MFSLDLGSDDFLAMWSIGSMDHTRDRDHSRPVIHLVPWEIALNSPNISRYTTGRDHNIEARTRRESLLYQYILWHTTYIYNHLHTILLCDASAHLHLLHLATQAKAAKFAPDRTRLHFCWPLGRHCSVACASLGKAWQGLKRGP